MYDEGLLRELLEGAGFEARRIEKLQHAVEGLSAREIAMGQVHGSPRGQLIAKRGADPEAVIDRVTQALEAAGGRGAAFQSSCTAVMVEARAS
jgi:hypothetical protein